MDNNQVIQTPTSFNQQAVPANTQNNNNKRAGLKVAAILISIVLVVIASIVTITILTKPTPPAEPPKTGDEDGEDYHPFASGRKIFADNEELDKDYSDKYDKMTKFYLELNEEMTFDQLKTLANSHGFNSVKANGDNGSISLGELVFVKFDVTEKNGTQMVSRYTLNREMNGHEDIRFVVPLDEDGKYEYYNGIDYVTYSSRKRAVNAFILDLEEAPVKNTNTGNDSYEPEEN